MARIREEKEEDEDTKDLIKLRATEEMVPRWFYKYLNVIATTRHSRTNDLTTSKALQWAIK